MKDWVKKYNGCASIIVCAERMRKSWRAYCFGLCPSVCSQSPRMHLSLYWECCETNDKLNYSMTSSDENKVPNSEVTVWHKKIKKNMVLGQRKNLESDIPRTVVIRTVILTTVCRGETACSYLRGDLLKACGVMAMTIILLAATLFLFAIMHLVTNALANGSEMPHKDSFCVLWSRITSWCLKSYVLSWHYWRIT